MMIWGMILFSVIVLLGFRREGRLKAEAGRKEAEREAARAAAPAPKRPTGRPRKTTNNHTKP